MAEQGVVIAFFAVFLMFVAVVLAEPRASGCPYCEHCAALGVRHSSDLALFG